MLVWPIRFIVVFPRARHVPRTWARPVQPTPSQPTSFKYICTANLYVQSARVLYSWSQWLRCLWRVTSTTAPRQVWRLRTPQESMKHVFVYSFCVFLRTGKLCDGPIPRPGSSTKCLKQGYTNSGRQIVRATKLCTVAPNICESSA